MIFCYFNRIFIFIIVAEKNYKYKISDFLKYELLNFMNFKNYILFEKIGDIGLNNKI